MKDLALKIIEEHAQDGAKLREKFFRSQGPLLCEAALRAAACLASGGKLLLCGNGGGAAQAQHMAAEFVNRFLMDRPALPAVALTTDTSALTAIANDLNFSQVFARQVEALGRRGDMLVGISTSGNSANVTAALQTARSHGLLTLGLTGRGGGEMNRHCDFLLDVPGASAPLIQEVHMAVGHLFCHLTDYYLFENVVALTPYLRHDNATGD